MSAAAGGMSEQAADLAAEERRVLSNIHDLLDSLQQEKQALLVSLSAHRASTSTSCSPVTNAHADIRCGRMFNLACCPSKSIK